MRLNEITGSVLPPTPENIERAKTFVLAKWRERADERGLDQPSDLTGSCKFSSMFAQRLFGGQLRGNHDHQYVLLPNDQILDLNVDAADVKAHMNPHKHDVNFGETVITTLRWNLVRQGLTDG